MERHGTMATIGMWLLGACLAAVPAGTVQRIGTTIPWALDRAGAGSSLSIESVVA